MVPEKSIKERMDEACMTLSGSELRDHIQTALCLSDFDNISVEQKQWLENLIVSKVFVSHEKALRESPQMAQQQPGSIDRISEPMSVEEARRDEGKQGHTARVPEPKKNHVPETGDPVFRGAFWGSHSRD